MLCSSSYGIGCFEAERRIYCLSPCYPTFGAIISVGMVPWMRVKTCLTRDLRSFKVRHRTIYTTLRTKNHEIASGDPFSKGNAVKCYYLIGSEPSSTCQITRFL